MENQHIIHGRRLKEVLWEELRGALRSAAVRTSEHAEFYLLNLLSDAHATNALRLADEERPLGLRYIEAMTAPTAERAKLLRAIGDTTLLAIGFFAERLRRGIMGTDYYAAIGGAAYGALADACGTDDAFADVYAELAAKFSLFVAALARLAPWNRPRSDAELFDLYRRWAESGDAQLASVLRRAGLIA
jgi:hypothetical protein